jgi:hypothetical protein
VYAKITLDWSVMAKKCQHTSITSGTKKILLSLTEKAYNYIRTSFDSKSKTRLKRTTYYYRVDLWCKWSFANENRFLWYNRVSLILIWYYNYRPLQLLTVPRHYLIRKANLIQPVVSQIDIIIVNDGAEIWRAVVCSEEIRFVLKREKICLKVIEKYV